MQIALVHTGHTSEYHPIHDVPTAVTRPFPEDRLGHCAVAWSRRACGCNHDTSQHEKVLFGNRSPWLEAGYLLFARKVCRVSRDSESVSSSRRWLFLIRSNADHTRRVGRSLYLPELCAPITIMAEHFPMRVFPLSMTVLVRSNPGVVMQ